eukprot:3995079-Prymnesium_polylepis.1
MAGCRVVAVAGVAGEVATAASVAKVTASRSTRDSCFERAAYLPQCSLSRRIHRSIQPSHCRENPSHPSNLQRSLQRTSQCSHEPWVGDWPWVEAEDELEVPVRVEGAAA